MTAAARLGLDWLSLMTISKGWLVPLTLICFAVSAFEAGPCLTEPSAAENWLLWQLQLMMPFVTSVSGQP